MNNSYIFSTTGAPMDREEEPKAKLTVLIVDDYEDARELTSLVLRQILIGVTISAIEAKNGLEALEILETHEVDLILTDWIMPEMDGLELLKTIRQREKTKDTPVIIISAVSNQDDILKAMSCGATEYIVKRFHIQDLEQKTKAFLMAPQK